MFLNQLVLVSFLLFVNFVNSSNKRMKAQTDYVNIMVVNFYNLLLNKNFCEADTKIYVRYCEMAFARLRSEKNSPYKYAYLNYQFFSSINARNKCNNGMVSLMDNNGSIYDKKSQHMAVCFGRPAVLWPAFNGQSNPFHDNILIYVVKNIMFIFENQLKYIRVFDTWKNIKEPDPNSVHDNLFVLPQPQYIMKSNQLLEELYKSLNNKESNLQWERNIANTSDTTQLMKLCILVFDSAPHVAFQTRQEAYRQQGMALWTKGVILFSFFTNSHAIYNHTLEMNIHKCRGNVGPQRADSKYAIGRGPNYHKIMVLEEINYWEDDKVLYEPVALIENIHSVFLKIIDIHEDSF